MICFMSSDAHPSDSEGSCYMNHIIGTLSYQSNNECLQNGQKIRFYLQMRRSGSPEDLHRHYTNIGTNKVSVNIDIFKRIILTNENVSWKPFSVPSK